MNEILNALTNWRSLPTAAYAPTDSGNHITHVPDTALSAVRLALGLDIPDTDWYVHHLVVAIDTWPEIARSLGETARTYDPARRACVEPVWVGAQLVPDETGVARCAWQPTVIPGSFARHLVLSGTTSALFDGQPVRTVTNSDGLLQVAWPASAGLQGMLDAGDPESLVAGTRITVTAEPAVYPWAAAAAVGRTTHGIAVLNRQALLDMFAAATTPMEATAVLAAAVCLDNASVYPPA